MVEHNRTNNCIHFLSIKETDSVLYVDETKQVRVEDESVFDAKQTYDYVIYRLSNCLTGGIQELEDKIADAFKCVKQDGHLVLLMENPYALHMFAGEADREGKLFRTLAKKSENQMNISGKILEKAVEKVLLHWDASKIGNIDTGNMYTSNMYTSKQENSNNSFDLNRMVKWYYPYPTIDFPVAIYSDAYLPKSGECVENYYNFEHARLDLFHETDAFDEVIKSGMFREFANCYMLIVGAPFEQELKYCRYSNERAEGLRIRTDILEHAVRKTAYDEKSINHIRKLAKWEGKLNQQLTSLEFQNKKLVANHITKMDENSVYFEFIKGSSLSELLDSLLAEDKIEQAKEMLLEFCLGLYRQPELVPFEEAKEFEQVFGKLDETKIEVLKRYQEINLAAPVTDIDMICQNILIADKVHVIDYEWTFDFKIPVGYLVYRILFFYLEFQDRKRYFEGEDLYDKLGINQELKKIYAQMETKFQKYVQGTTKLISDSYYESGKPVLSRERLEKNLKELARSAVSIELATKDGVRNEIRECKKDADGILSFTIDFEPGEVDKITVYPGVKNALIRICLLQEDEEGSKELDFVANGLMINPILYLFDEVAQISITDILDKTHRVYMSLEVVAMPDTFVVESKRSILELREMLANRELQMENLLNSASWRLTKPLRKLKGNKNNE